MATCIEIISRAMRILGVLSEGETPSAQEAQDGLSNFNALLDSIANSQQMIFARSRDVIPMAAGVASFTVGPTGSIVTTRPVNILESSYIDYQGVSYPLSKLTLEDYGQIAVKSVGGIPTGFYVQTDMENVQLTFWPIPSLPMTLYLWSNKQITQFTSLTDELVMPPGYDRMLAYMLAVDWAAEFQVEPTPNTIRQAATARRNIKRTNTEVPRMKMPYGIPSHNNWYDWQYP